MAKKKKTKLDEGDSFKDQAQSSRFKVPPWRTVQNCADNNTISETEDHLELNERISLLA